jgi:hypothetical protein
MIDQKKCRVCNIEKDQDQFRIIRCAGKPDWRETRCIECERIYRRAWQNANYIKHPEEHKRRTLTRYHDSKVDPDLFLFKMVRQRARHLEIEFALAPEDVVIPECCPVLGIKLSAPGGGLCENSPTVDRFNPEKGYTKGNVAVMSMKANRLKNNATIAELEAILAWMRARA